VSANPDTGPRVDKTTGEVLNGPESVATAGARGIASVAKERAKRTTLQNGTLFAALAAVGFGLLYVVTPHASSEQKAAAEMAKKEKAARLNAEMPVRRIHADPPAPPPTPPEVVESQTTAEAILGPKPDAPMAGPGSPGFPANAPNASPEMASGGTPRHSHQARVLASPVLYRTTTAVAAAGSPDPMELAQRISDRMGTDPVASSAGGTGGGSALGAALRPTVTPAVRAERLPNRRWLLPKGSFADCTLETAIDSTLPGMTTCVLALDVFSADGTVVLLERGTRLVGETRSDVRSGQRRVAVLWTEARTPTGVVAHLDSLGTDELGRSGVPGSVDNHFSERFGAAILISLIDSGAQALANSSSSGNGAVVVNPNRATDVMTEVLRSTLSIPPTISVPQGVRLQVLVARDVDFRSVYALKDRN
jgi:type IV secretion system protein VirB10